MFGKAYRTIRTAERCVNLYASSQCSSLRSSKAITGGPPALITSISRSPKVLSISLNIFIIDSPSDKSQTILRISDLETSLISFDVSARVSSFLPQIATLHPSNANALAVAFPSPLLPAETSTALFLIFSSIIIFLHYYIFQGISCFTSSFKNILIPSTST